MRKNRHKRGNFWECEAMKTDEWKCYHRAVIPRTPPHVVPDLRPIENGSIWKIWRRGRPLLARWITDFDCGYETNWWYVIKDTPFDIDALKAKRRYEITKGLKNFDVRIIDPRAYKEELYRVQVAAVSAWPSKYRPLTDQERFTNGIDAWGRYAVFGAFLKETKELAGYALLSSGGEGFINFSTMMTVPSLEKYSVNAALVWEVVTQCTKFLSAGGILCDGARSIRHETAFQDYLEKYFGFRKAYCHLHVRYHPKIKWLIRLLFPLRKALLALDGMGVVHSVNGVLKMEEICRGDAAEGNR